MIEHFSKWLELVLLPDYGSEGATYAFFDRVCSRFGAPTKVLTKQGMEFCGDFQKSCEKALINHRTTSRNHLQRDGLTKQMVQMVK
jgi:hypothetical protein